jgi:hypothetical protein
MSIEKNPPHRDMKANVMNDSALVINFDVLISCSIFELISFCGYGQSRLLAYQKLFIKHHKNI